MDSNEGCTILKTHEMKHSIFENGNKSDVRQIVIWIDEKIIHFSFFSDFHSQQIFMYSLSEAEKKKIEKEQSEPSYFYWVRISEWETLTNTWERQMKEKSWFTEEMLQFIKSNI